MALYELELVGDNPSMVGANPILGATTTTWGQILGQFWPVVAVSLGVSLLATPLCRFIALRKGIVDRPDDFLKPHKVPIPYLGGVAVFAGWLAGILVSLLAANIALQRYQVLGIAVAGAATMSVGLFDDLRFMRPKVKLACNIAVALWLLSFGMGDQIIQVFTGLIIPKNEALARWLELTYSVPITVFIVVGACNATNLIDGLDGLCAGVLGIISIGFAILAIHLRVHSNVDVGNERIVLALAMLGAAAGFLPFNLNPAKIFLGDAGFHAAGTQRGHPHPPLRRMPAGVVDDRRFHGFRAPHGGHAPGSCPAVAERQAAHDRRPEPLLRSASRSRP